MYEQRRPLLATFETNAEAFRLPTAWIYLNETHSGRIEESSGKTGKPYSDPSLPNPNANEWDFSYAGIVHYVFSTLVRRSSSFLRRGLRVRPRAFAHSTDRLKELVEFREHYLTAHEGGNEGEHASRKSSSRLQRIAKEILPGFLKHVGFATLVFSAYETIYDDHYLELQKEIQSSDPKFLAASILGPWFCGGISGTLGGMFYVTWDTVAHHWHRIGINKEGANLQPQYHPMSRPKIILAHTITQSALFGGYALAKQFFVSSLLHAKVSIFCHYYLPSWISLEHGDPSHRSPSDPTFSAFERRFAYPSSFLADILCIATCGGMAGVMSEHVKHWIKLYDFLYLSRSTSEGIVAKKREEFYELVRKAKNQSIGSRLKTYRHILFPRGHHVITAAIPMSLAFVAYEYGKEMTAKEHHHHS